MPLNGQLTDLGGCLEQSSKTAPTYRLYALAGGAPPRPGLVRVANSGSSIDLEVWSLPLANVGSFLRQIPAPLTLGTIALSDGSEAVGFLCEGHAISNAKDITELGGWRAYLKTLA